MRGQGALLTIAVAGDGTVGVLYYVIAAASRGGYGPARVAVATSSDRGRHWSRHPVAGAFNLLTASRNARSCCGLGDYEGMARLPHGLAAAFSMAKRDRPKRDRRVLHPHHHLARRIEQGHHAPTLRHPRHQWGSPGPPRKDRTELWADRGRSRLPPTKRIRGALVPLRLGAELGNRGRLVVSARRSPAQVIQTLQQSCRELCSAVEHEPISPKSTALTQADWTARESLGETPPCC